MTFTVKIRGVADRPIAVEYMCPVHGRFTVTIARDANGDAPNETTCPVKFESRPLNSLRDLDDALAAGDRALICRKVSPFVISAPLVGVRRVEAVKGGWEKPARKTFLDTRDLGEGQDIDEWRENRAAIRDDQRRQSLKELIDG